MNTRALNSHESGIYRRPYFFIRKLDSIMLLRTTSNCTTDWPRIHPPGLIPEKGYRKWLKIRTILDYRVLGTFNKMPPNEILLWSVKSLLSFLMPIVPKRCWHITVVERKVTTNWGPSFVKGCSVPNFWLGFYNLTIFWAPLAPEHCLNAMVVEREVKTNLGHLLQKKCNVPNFWPGLHNLTIFSTPLPQSIAGIVWLWRGR